MAYFQGSVRSCELAMDTQLCVILPWDRPAENQQSPCKTLYLLHGLGDNATAWTRYTNIERYARQYGIAVVMPEVQRSFYRDMRFGLKYFSYVANELPELCNRLFGLDAGRGNNYIAGLSMGGYGALKCGFSHPEKYAGCASFSGAVDVHYLLSHKDSETLSHQLVGLFGNELTPEDGDDLFKLAGNVAKLPPKSRPELFITCGTEDLLYESNLELIKRLDEVKLDYTFHEWRGEHEWGFWDESVQLALKFFLDE